MISLRVESIIQTQPLPLFFLESIIVLYGSVAIVVAKAVGLKRSSLSLNILEYSTCGGTPKNAMNNALRIEIVITYGFIG